MKPYAFIFLISSLWLSTALAQQVSAPASEDNAVGIEVAPQVALPIHLEFKESASVSSSRVYVSQIATCQGLREICDEVEGVDIGKPPLPGKVKYLQKKEIIEILKDEFEKILISHKGKERIKLSSESVVLNADKVRDELQAFMDRMVAGRKNMRAKVIQCRMPRDIKIRPGSFRLVFPRINQGAAFSLRSLYHEYVGQKSIDVVYQADDGSGDHFVFRVSARINVEVYTPVTIEAKRKGESIHVNDFHYQWIKIRRNHHEFLSRIEPYEGWNYSGNVSAQEPISQRSLQKPRLVERGRLVDVIMSRGNMKVSTKGKALETGAKDDYIRVFYPSTKKQLRAKVLGRDKVEVRL